MSGFLDVQVKKQQNTWSKRKQWIRGTDGDLLLELYTIYQTWGLQNVVVAMTAMEHVFAQDVKKRTFIAQALLLVDELRKKLRKSEGDTSSNITEAKYTEITKEMIFDRIKETKILCKENATRVVDTCQADYAKEELHLQNQDGQPDDTRLQEIAAFLKTAKKELFAATESLIKGVGGYNDQDYKEAIAALTPPDDTALDRLLDGTNSNRKKQYQSSNSSAAGSLGVTEAKIDSKEAADQLKQIWSSLLKAVILQNTDRSQGEVSYKVTEKKKESQSTQHLGKLASSEMAAVLTMVKNSGEGMVSFASRLQEKERFIQWMVSVLLGPAEQETLLINSNSILFEALNKILPMESMWMEEKLDQDGNQSFAKLSDRDQGL